MLVEHLERGAIVRVVARKGEPLPPLARRLVRIDGDVEPRGAKGDRAALRVRRVEGGRDDASRAPDRTGRERDERQADNAMAAIRHTRVCRIVLTDPTQ